MILYLDSSALVKLYVFEAHSDEVRAAFADARICCCHLIAYAEVCAGLARKWREQPLPQRALDKAVGALREDWVELEVVEVTWRLVLRAGELAREHALRGFDSVQLAAAEAVWHAVEPDADFRFAVFDEGLAAAARNVGMGLLDAR